LAVIQNIGLGAAPDDGNGDPIRTGGQKINDNFSNVNTELGQKASTSGTLAQFAATTSAQLAGVISDETGTGALVFATSPTLVTPLLGTPASVTLTNATGLPTTGVIDAVIGSPTYTTLEDRLNNVASAGWVSGGMISNAVGGLFDVSAGSGYIRDAVSSTSNILSFDWIASIGIAIGDGVILGVYIDYNAGSPIISTADITTPFPFVNLKTTFLLGLIMREGTKYTFKSFQTRGGDVAALINSFASGAFTKPRINNTGLILSETGTRNVAISAGSVFVGLNPISIASLDTSAAGTFDTYYTTDSGTTWVRTAIATQWDNLQYNAIASGLVTMSNNKFSNQWIYMNLDGSMSLLYGQNEFSTIAGANAESVPTLLPPKLKSQLSWLVGRIQFTKNAASATDVESIYTQVFIASAAANHANLTNLSWTTSSHTGTLSTLAGFDGSNVASVYSLSGTGTTIPTTTAPTISNGVYSGSIVESGRVISAAGAVTVVSTDNMIIINKTVGAPTAVNLHASPATWHTLVIKDDKGDAATNNITITPNAGNIDGAGNFVMSISYGSAKIVYNGTQWNVI